MNIHIDLASHTIHASEKEQEIRVAPENDLAVVSTMYRVNGNTGGESSYPTRHTPYNEA